MDKSNFQATLFRRSGRLFADPSFFNGFARALDLGATFNEYNSSNSAEEADFWSLASDWCAIGDDLSYAIQEYEDASSSELKKHSAAA